MRSRSRCRSRSRGRSRRRSGDRYYMQIPVGAR